MQCVPKSILRFLCDVGFYVVLRIRGHLSEGSVSGKAINTMEPSVFREWFHFIIAARATHEYYLFVRGNKNSCTKRHFAKPEGFLKNTVGFRGDQSIRFNPWLFPKDIFEPLNWSWHVFFAGMIFNEEDQEVRDLGYQKHAFNMLISNRLGYHREVPDTRDAKYVLIFGENMV